MYANYANAVIDSSLYRGVSSESNWVFKDLVIAGAFPAYDDEWATNDLLSKILDTGVSVFVCLQSE